MTIEEAVTVLDRDDNLMEKGYFIPADLEAIRMVKEFAKSWMMTAANLRSTAPEK